MNIDKAEELLQRAGFETYNKSLGNPLSKIKNGFLRPSICYFYNGCNSFTGILYTDQPPNTILEIIFSECKKVGRIQLRQELNHSLSIQNYE